MVPEGSGLVSRYLMDKFLFTVDRDPELVERYRDDPVGTVTWWEETHGRPPAGVPTASRRARGRS